jgi:hypothetical protein
MTSSQDCALIAGFIVLCVWDAKVKMGWYDGALYTASVNYSIRVFWMAVTLNND